MTALFRKMTKRMLWKLLKVREEMKLTECPQVRLYNQQCPPSKTAKDVAVEEGNTSQEIPLALIKRSINHAAHV